MSLLKGQSVGRFGITQTLGSATEPVGSGSNFCAYIYKSPHFIGASHRSLRVSWKFWRSIRIFCAEEGIVDSISLQFFSALIYRICGSFVKAFGCVDLVIRCSDCCKVWFLWGILLGWCWSVVKCLLDSCFVCETEIFSCDCCRSLISVWIRCEGKLKWIFQREKIV